MSDAIELLPHGALIAGPPPQRAGQMRAIVFEPLPEGYELLAVVGADGQPYAAASVRRVGPQPVRGCGHCEGWHPVDVTRCPLLGKQIVTGLLGPYRRDGELFYLTFPKVALSDEGTRS
jgi:hypothetical protein